MHSPELLQCRVRCECSCNIGDAANLVVAQPKNKQINKNKKKIKKNQKKIKKKSHQTNKTQTPSENQVDTKTKTLANLMVTRLVLLVSKAASGATSSIKLWARLRTREEKNTNQETEEKTQGRIVTNLRMDTVPLAVSAVQSAEMSCIWLPLRLKTDIAGERPTGNKDENSTDSSRISDVLAPINGVSISSELMKLFGRLPDNGEL
jgi:hypothetical protein